MINEELKKVYDHFNYIGIYLESNILYENKCNKNNKGMIKQYNIIVSLKYNDEVIQRSFIYYPKKMNVNQNIITLNYEQHSFGNHIKKMGDELITIIKLFESFDNVKLLFYAVSLTGHVFFTAGNHLILNNKKIREGYIKYIK